MDKSQGKLGGKIEGMKEISHFRYEKRCCKSCVMYMQKTKNSFVHVCSPLETKHLFTQLAGVIKLNVMKLAMYHKDTKNFAYKFVYLVIYTCTLYFVTK